MGQDWEHLEPSWAGDAASPGASLASRAFPNPLDLARDIPRYAPQRAPQIERDLGPDLGMGL